ncbi:dual specificity protein phosphatase family protein [Martelella radicis]|uniref:Protein tyrosine/serine phosphatase n=1 Tax=Martelella radicis TaxID=1397476 RepID=A0A7W6PCM9_9HYPH|nr:dual specificity protein phosphatase family protein [Martelella radicis]MBB4124706.1 protein tyrosine/serine phosphatase [Martelella radicis]
MGVRKVLRRFAWTFGTLVLCGGVYLGGLQLTGNFHEVHAGTLYRSAQPSADDLAGYAKRHGIKTVINLRGAHPGRDWYDQEVAASEALGITHIDFGMSDSRELPLDRSLELLSLMRDAEKPLLIHCKAGADRTGLASVMYLQQLAGVDEETAEWQLSPIYGHLNIPMTGPFAMDQTWERLEKDFGLPS